MVRNAVIAATTIPTFKAGHSICNTLTPPALIATTSLSVERRPNPINEPMRNAKGTVNMSMLGIRLATAFRTVIASAFLRISSSVRRPNSLVKTTKVSTTRVITEGEIISW
jgi:hypothetical protein